jgi:hypothetical protein
MPSVAVLKGEVFSVAKSVTDRVSRKKLAVDAPVFSRSLERILQSNFDFPSPPGTEDLSKD